MNSRVWFVSKPGSGRGLYMISVMTSGVLRLDGPGGSRSSVNPDVDCPWAGAPPRKTKRVKAKAGVAKRKLTAVRCFINEQNWATALRWFPAHAYRATGGDRSCEAQTTPNARAHLPK